MVRRRPRPRTTRPRVRSRHSGARRSDADLSRHLLRDQDEVIVEIVRRHWITQVRPGIELAGGLALLLWLPFIDLDASFFVLAVAGVLIAHGAAVMSAERRDRFIITNMRVFRVDGLVTIRLATMPLSRILDITVVRTPLGRILSYGHFCFESAAQEQGLREIRFVADPLRRDHTIQSLVQRAGLRGSTTT